MSLDDHRALYRADLHIPRLVSRQPPTTLDPNTGEPHVEPGAATGMNMSGRLLKYLGHPEGYGETFPWARALYALRWNCRKNHPHHRRSDRRYWQGALCWKIVQLTVIRDFKPDEAAQILRLDSPEPVLSQALSFIEETIDHARARAERRAREDAGHGPGAVPVGEGVCNHPDCGGRPHYRPAPHPETREHREECPQCRKNVA